MPNRWPLMEFILILMTKKDTPVRSISPPFDFAERIETAGTSAGPRERGGKRIDFKRAPYFRPLPPRLGDSREEEPPTPTTAARAREEGRHVVVRRRRAREEERSFARSLQSCASLPRRGGRERPGRDPSQGKGSSLPS